MKTFRLAFCSLSLVLAAFANTASATEGHGHTDVTSYVQSASQNANASIDHSNIVAVNPQKDVVQMNAEQSGARTLHTNDAPNGEGIAPMSSDAASSSQTPGLKLCCGTAGDYGVICWRC